MSAATVITIREEPVIKIFDEQNLLFMFSLRMFAVFTLTSLFVFRNLYFQSRNKTRNIIIEQKNSQYLAGYNNNVCG